jgi:hypothetical protein
MVHPSTISIGATGKLMMLALAAALSYVLCAPMTGRELSGQGLEQISYNGCTAVAWRNPVTGHNEVRRGHLDSNGFPVCN